MQVQGEIPGIPTPEEEAKANFKLDTEGSFASLIITPIHAISDDGETDYLRFQETIEIKPYPNPYSFGGLWGNGSLKPEDEGKALADFHHWVDPWVARGLTRVEIKREPGKTERVPTEAQRQVALERIRGKGSKKSKAEARDIPGQQTLF